MSSKEFFYLVANMRQNQKQYFKTKNLDSLQESKRLEKIVDSEIERVQKILREPILNFEFFQWNFSFV